MTSALETETGELSERFTYLGLRPVERNLLEVLCSTSEHLDYFLSNYSQISRKFGVMYAITKYRQYRIDHTIVTFRQFQEMYENDNKSALEHLLMTRVSDKDVKRLTGWLSIGEVNLGLFYKAHLEEPYFQLGRLLTMLA